MNNEQLELVKKLTKDNYRLSLGILELSKHLQSLVIDRHAYNIMKQCEVLLEILGDEDE